jgi:tRNA dimethylallyltransferase
MLRLKSMADLHNKLIVILGPTATGKSDLAVQIARQVRGEIISADSRQVYKGMDIGTGKITKKEMRGVPHYLLDVVGPKTNFNVNKFQKLAKQKIKDLQKHGKIAILVGGTGFWIDALVYDQKFPEVKPDTVFRIQFSAFSTPQLFEKFKKLDPKRAATIDQHNRHRLIRAIEIAKSGVKLQPLNYKSPYDVLLIGLDLPQEELDKKISKRLDARLRKGMVKEVEKLHKQGVSWKRLEAFGLEYKYIALYLQKKSDTPTNARAAF